MQLSCSSSQHPKLRDVKALPGFPSGSALVVFDKQVYVAGDDARSLLKIDSNFNAVDSIALFDSDQLRLPKDSKPDIESAALVKLKTGPLILLPGSGSLKPYRDICLLIDPASGEKIQWRLDTFYQRLQAAGIRELNIEGAAELPAGIVLSSRGNKSYRKNSLIFVPRRFWEKQETIPIRLVKVGNNAADTAVFTGVSGLDYSPVTDQLFLTASTENTYNSYDDGSIGKSYLWIINDISSKRRLDAMNPDRIIDLESIDQRFRGQKIESVCIVKDGRQTKQLLLVSDDDKGGTMLFRLEL